MSKEIGKTKGVLMKCVCCEKEILIQYLEWNEYKLPYYECCGYQIKDVNIHSYKNNNYPENIVVDFKGTFLGHEAEFRSYETCTNISFNPHKEGNGYFYDTFIWNRKFDFKNKESQIKKIEKMMIFI